MKTRQLCLGGNVSEFAEYWKNSGRKVHGGEHAEGRRKTARPFNSKKPIHIVLRSEKARGPFSLRNPRLFGNVVSRIRFCAADCGVKIFKLSVNSNHLHILAQAKSKLRFQKFLRVVAGQIAQAVTAAVKGNPVGKFWDGLVFTRIAEWGKDFRELKAYVVQNQLETEGIIAYRPRVKMISPRKRVQPAPRKNRRTPD